MSSQSITVIDHTTNLLNQTIGIPDHTLDQTKNMSNQISNVPDQIGEYGLNRQNLSTDMSDQIGEYWLDYSMTYLGEITINGIHKTWPNLCNLTILMVKLSPACGCMH